MARAKPTRSDPALGAALAAGSERLEAGEHEPALASLLEAWRDSGHPRIADAVDRLSAIVTENEPPITAVGSTSARAAWFAAAKAQRPAALGRLLEAIPDAIDRVKRLEALLEWPVDPRIGTAAKQWLERPPVKGKNRPGFFNALWALIENTPDARLSTLIAELSLSSSRSRAVNAYGLRAWLGLTELGGTYEKLPGPRPVDEALLDRLDDLLESPKKKHGGSSANEDELYERIYADPSDDEPRAVLADLLQQRGEPRGELIALQLARHATGAPPSAAEKKLLKTWGSTWLGPLEELLLKDGVEYERGFLARARLGTAPRGDAAREWSTVTHVDATRASRYAGGGSGKLLASPTLRNVRHVRGLSADDHASLTAARRLPWETVGWRAWDWEALGAAAEGSGELFEAARTLIIEQSEAHPLTTDIDEVAALLDHWPHIDAFEIDAETSLAAEIMAYRKLKRLVVDFVAVRLTLEEGTLTAALRYMVEDTIADVVTAVRALGPNRIALEVDGRGFLEGDQLVKKYAGVSIRPVADLARELGLPLRVNGAAFDP